MRRHSGSPARFGCPLLNAQILGFQQKAAEAQARQAVAQYEQSVLVAFKEVEDSFGRKDRYATSVPQLQQVEALRSASASPTYAIRAGWQITWMS